MSKLKKNFIIVMGCTGTGKSDAAIELAKKFNGEVISADSQQIYKGLDIVTNKVTEDEKKGVKHHLMDFLDPVIRDYNVQAFKDDCYGIMNNLWDEGKVPIICGGTSYYIESILFKDNLITTDKEKVKEFREQLKEKSNDELYEMLLKIDHLSANQVHRNNRARVQRALEIALTTGTKKSDIIKEQRKNVKDLIYDNVLIFNMDADEKVLDERLDKRIDKMVSRGLKDEIRDFYKKYHDKLGNFGIMQSIGLKEFKSWFSNETESNFNEGIKNLQLHTRQYARKQRKWLRQRLMNRDNNINNIYLMDTTKVEEFYTKNIPIMIDIVNDFINDEVYKDVEESPYCKLWKRSTFTKEDSINIEDVNRLFVCESCSLEIHGIESWKAHLKGKKHKMKARQIIN